MFCKFLLDYRRNSVECLMFNVLVHQNTVGKVYVKYTFNQLK